MRQVVLVACVWVFDFVDNRNGLAVPQQLEVLKSQLSPAESVSVLKFCCLTLCCCCDPSGTSQSS